MKHSFTNIEYRSTNAFSTLAIDYLEQKKTLKDFYVFPTNKVGIDQAIESRKNKSIDRELLVSCLQKQYLNTENNALVHSNILSLSKENTFTICTAHQPNLLSGYLYFFYKILHAIQLSEYLNTQYPDLHFVPVYYMGSEDNDLAELGQFDYEGVKYRWDANGQKGAVGRMHTESLKPLLEQLFTVLGPPGIMLDEVTKLLKDSYLKHTSISEATRCFCNAVFGKYGLIVLDPDDTKLKSTFKNVIKDDLLNHNALVLAEDQSAKLGALYKVQAYPRSINFFYLKDHIRERIEFNNGNWQVLNTSITFTETEILNEIENHPDRFSPNVILRGVYQETILPNICFIGGGAEIAYWLQLLPIFKHYNVFFPMLILRQSAQIINNNAQRIINKLNLSFEQIFEPTELLFKNIIADNIGDSWNISEEKTAITELINRIKKRATSIDSTLEATVMSSEKKIIKLLNTLEHKMYRASTKSESVKKQQIEKLKEILHINHTLQERVENFLPYTLQYGFQFFDELKNNIEPFQPKFMIIQPHS